MIKLLKSGKWALSGLEVIELAEGDEVDFGPANNVDLVSAGWAEWSKDPEEAGSTRKKAK